MFEGFGGLVFKLESKRVACSKLRIYGLANRGIACYKLRIFELRDSELCALNREFANYLIG